jgi:hypothetical protein
MMQPTEPFMSHPATKKRGADPHVPAKAKRDIAADAIERKLEQGLEESMAGSDPVSITQPSSTKSDQRDIEKDRR